MVGASRGLLLRRVLHTALLYQPNTQVTWHDRGMCRLDAWHANSSHPSRRVNAPRRIRLRRPRRLRACTWRRERWQHPPLHRAEGVGGRVSVSLLSRPVRLRFHHRDKRQKQLGAFRYNHTCEPVDCHPAARWGLTRMSSACIGRDGRPHPHPAHAHAAVWVALLQRRIQERKT